MTSLREMSVLITGAAGFIGSALGNRLVAEGVRVQGLDSYFHACNAPRSFSVENGDVRFSDLILMRAKNVDTIVHLAAAINVDFSHVMPEAAFDINLDGTINILEAARKLDKNVVFASSSEIYGTHQDTLLSDFSENTGMDERHPLDGQSPYAASKIAADRACFAWSKTYGMRVNCVRLFNVYGPWQADDGYGGVIAKFVRLALQGKAMPIYGNGDQRRDYLWIDDAVEAYVLAIRSKFRTPVNFGTGSTVSINEIAQKIGEKISPNIWRWEKEPPRPGEVDLLRCDWSKAKSMGWKPTVAFDEGLQRYVDWARSLAHLSD